MIPHLDEFEAGQLGMGPREAQLLHLLLICETTTATIANSAE